MSSESADEMAEPIVVDVEADPRATQPTSVRIRSVHWLVPLLALVAVVAGVAIGRAEPVISYEPAVVRGLADEPSFVWQQDLDEMLTANAVGDTVAVYPIEWRGDELVVELLEPAEGGTLWAADLAGFATAPIRAWVQVRDLRGTDYMAIAVVPRGGAPQQTLLISAVDGSVLNSLELPQDSLLTTTDRGHFVLLTGGNPYGEIAWLGADSDPAEPTWRVESEMPVFLNRGGPEPRFREHGSYVGVGVEWWGLPSETSFEVWSVDDGEAIHEPSWITASAYHFVSGRLVVVDEGGHVVAYDADTGEELWQIETCRCRLHAAGGHLMMVMGDNPGVVDLHLIDPRDGSVVWETAIPREQRPVFDEDSPRILMVGELFVDIRSERDSASELTRTCFTPVDGETGAAGATRCLDDVYFPVVWPGEEQLILGHESTDGFQSIALTAVTLPEIEPRWSFTLPSGTGRIDLVDSHLVIYDETTRTIGVLG